MSDYTGGIRINLTEEDIKEAIEWGRKNKDSDIILHSYSFGDHLYMEWEDGGIIQTKTFALASLSVALARQGKSPSKAEIDEIINSDTLAIEFTARGEKTDFIKGSKAYLKQGEKTIRPVKTEIDKEIKCVPNVSILGEEIVTIYEGCLVASFLYSEIDLKSKTTIALVKKYGSYEFVEDFSWYK